MPRCVWVSTFIFIIVGAVLAYAQIKFRAKSEADEHVGLAGGGRAGEGETPIRPLLGPA